MEYQTMDSKQKLYSLWTILTSIFLTRITAYDSGTDGSAEASENNPQPDQQTANPGLSGCLFTNLTVNSPFWLIFQPGRLIPIADWESQDGWIGQTLMKAG
jgi:hypothetical protein